MIKTCSRCKETKPTSDFCKDVRQKDGLDARCRTCHAESNARSWRKATVARKARQRGASASWQKRMIESGLCLRCGNTPVHEQQRRCLPCQLAENTTKRKHRASLRAQALEQYGGARCACCSETIEKFLTIDHINNDGAEHRRTLNDKGATIYRWLKKHNYPPGYQVLCFNCNCGRQYNGGTCPHRTLAQ